MKTTITLLTLISMMTLLPISAFAARGGGGGGTSIGFLGGFSNAEQTHINTLRGRANLRSGGITASDLDQAWEFGTFIQWRWSYMGFQLRPTYFTQSEGDGAYQYSVKGYSGSGIFKLYPLESGELRLFFQAGVTWANLETNIKEADYSVVADGSNMGYLIGVGVELNFGTHALFIEGGWRYLEIERNIVRSSSGTPASGSVTQSNINGELEYDNRDLSTNMTGSQMLAGYMYQF